MNLKNQIAYWLPVYLYAALIFFISSQPVLPAVMTGNIYYTYMLHTIQYFGLSLLLFRALLKSKFKERAFLFAILIAVAYGITDEIHQIFVPGRIFSPVDVLFNGIGSSLILIYSFSIFQNNRLLTKILS